MKDWSRLSVRKGSGYQWGRGQALSEKGSRLSVREGSSLSGRVGGVREAVYQWERGQAISV